jgi:hypothetical protein
MMATFRPYTTKEITDAAIAYGIDPKFARAVYAVESSRGTNPRAMTARTVKRKRDSTIVRGPFQLEDDTTADLIRENKLGNVNVDDPDTHLDLAMRQMRKLRDRYNGDPVKMAQAYLGRGTDELGTTSEGYGNKVIAEMQNIKNEDAVPDQPIDMSLGAATPADDLYGLPAMPLPQPPTMTAFGGGRGGPIERDPLGLPMYISHATRPQPPPSGPSEMEAAQLDRYINSLVDQEFEGKDFTSAAAA